jgi:predicted small secreted protein
MAVLRMPAAGALMTLIALAGAAGSLGACNTAAGFGQDMSQAGHAVTNSADRLKNGE